MKENQFTVDLGSIKLTEADRNNINAAIQKAVAGEIANLNMKNRVVLIPANKWIKGPIVNGIIIRPIDILDIEKLIDKTK